MLTQVKFVLGNFQPSDFAPVLDMATDDVAKIGDKAALFRLADHVERVCREHCGWASATEPEHRDFMLNIAVHAGNMGYVRHRLQTHDQKLYLNELLQHAALCPENREQTFEKYLRHLHTGARKQHYKCSWGNIEKSPNTPPNVNMVKVILKHGANPNAVLGDRRIWRSVLENIVDCNDDHAQRQWWELFESFMEYGADYAQDIDIWAWVLFREEYLTNEGMKNTARVFKVLLSCGLQPGAAWKDLRIWDAFISYLKKLPSGNHDGVGAILEVLDMFLHCGARTSRIHAIPRTAQGHACFPSMSWLGNMLASVWPHHVEQYERFLRHRLSPNERIQGGFDDMGNNSEYSPVRTVYRRSKLNEDNSAFPPVRCGSSLLYASRGLRNDRGRY
jgi:hypothetical protein